MDISRDLSALISDDRPWTRQDRYTKKENDERGDFASTPGRTGDGGTR